MENGSVSGDGSDSDLPEKSDVIKVIESIELYYTPFLVFFGSLGNCLSVIVFFCTRLRKLSSSYYLAALALSDTGFLAIIFIAWLNLVDVPFFNRSVVCELCVYASSVCSFLSAWFVVAFTVERFIAVGYPLKRPSMCTVSRAKLVIAALTTSSLVFYVPHIFIAGLQPGVVDPSTNDTESTVFLCGLNKDYHDLNNLLNSIDFFVVLLLPVLAIFVINASICATVWRLARIRRTMTANDRHPATSSLRHPQGSQTKVTKMLLIVSTVFVCLNLPSYICRLVLHFQETAEKETMIVWQQASMILFNTNFGINFVLYCVCGQNFRKALLALCCPRRQRTSETTRITVVSEFGRSMSTRRTISVNGSLREAHELLPLSR